MDLLTTLGVISTAAAILFYYLEPRHRFWVLAFAAASLSSAIYAFIQGAWPFGVAEVFWVGVALHRFWAISYVPGVGSRAPASPPATAPASMQPCRAGAALRIMRSRGALAAVAGGETYDVRRMARVS